MKTHIFQKKAFTIVELLVVIAIIGVLATLVTVNLLGAQKKSRDTRRVADLETLKSAILMYQDDTGNLPETSEFVDITADAQIYPLVTGGYTGSLPCDPSGCKVVSGANNSGYMYYRKDFVGYPCSTGLPALGGPYDNDHFALYGHMEAAASNTTQFDLFDTCVGTTMSSVFGDGDTGFGVNFRIGN